MSTDTGIAIPDPLALNTLTPQDTSAEEPDGGNLRFRFRGGPRWQGKHSGLLNSITAGPVVSSPFARTSLPTLQTSGAAAIRIIGVCWLSNCTNYMLVGKDCTHAESGKDKMVREGGDSTTASGAGLNKRRGIVHYLLISLALWVGATPIECAIAGEYELTEGSGVPVCEAYRRNFEPRHDSEPMACERQYSPAIPGFAALPWRKLDLKKHFQLYREAEIQLATDVYGGQGAAMSREDAQQVAKDLNGKAQHLQVELFVARIPLFNDGNEVTVLSVRELGCGPIPKPDVKISRLFILNKAMTHIDQRKQQQLEGWNNNATIELFDGTPYLEGYVSDDGWGNLFTASGFLSVATYDDKRFEAVCRINFTPSIANGNKEISK
jgi:hypothetical protein